MIPRIPSPSHRLSSASGGSGYRPLVAEEDGQEGQQQQQQQAGAVVLDDAVLGVPDEVCERANVGMHASMICIRRRSTHSTTSICVVMGVIVIVYWTHMT